MAVVSMALILLPEAVRGRRSGEEDFVEAGWDWGDCLSGNIAPILDATLPRRVSAETFSFCGCSNPAFRSGLDAGLAPFLPGLNASFNLRPGDGDRC